MHQARLRAPFSVIPLLCALAAAGRASAEAGAAPPLLPEPVFRALATEVSGTNAKHTLQELTLFHRMRGSRGFRAAAELIRDHAIAAGLSDVHIIELPTDGKIFYGTQRSRPAWDVEFAELWEQTQTSDGKGWIDSERIASFEARPVTLAQDSESGEATSELVDVGEGTSEKDYEGKDVRGKLVLVSGQPGGAVPLAVGKFGAAGLVSSAQNQVTAWWKEDENLVRWGHLDTFGENKTFAFMVSLKQARAWQERLSKGEVVRLRAVVRAGQHPGHYDIVTGSIPGMDPVLRDQDIVFSCHLDHLRPGANDNASGCSAILEASRTLATLVKDGRIPPPRRTIRFIWPAEVEGTISLLASHPEFAQRTRTVIHMDMVGGLVSATRSVFHITRTPESLPTFVSDVAEEFGRYVNEQTYEYAATNHAKYPLADPEGDKGPLQADFALFSEGSDHSVWSEGSWRVPAIYFNDWPDRYIHTNGDTIANIDATKLLRAAFLGAASAYYLAQLNADGLPELTEMLRRHALDRTAQALLRREELLARSSDTSRVTDADTFMRFHFEFERAVFQSIANFTEIPAESQKTASVFIDRLEALTSATTGTAGAASEPNAPSPYAGAELVYERAPEPKGPMNGFGYGYLDDHVKSSGLARPELLDYTGLWGGGGEYGYVALNLVDGQRTVKDIRDRLTAIYGPVPIEKVGAFLETLEKIGVLKPRSG